MVLAHAECVQVDAWCWGGCDGVGLGGVGLGDVRSMEADPSAQSCTTHCVLCSGIMADAGVVSDGVLTVLREAPHLSTCAPDVCNFCDQF